jgi:hypothetical protein
MSTQQTITVVGTDEVRQALKQLGDDAPHALRIATTNLGEHAQRTMRAQIGNRFQFRGTLAGFQRAVVFQAPRAAGRKVSAILKVGSDQGGTKATGTRNLGVILARHEEAGSRTESGQTFFDGQGRQMSGLGFFIPAPGLRTASQNVPRKLYPRNIGAAMRQGVDGGYTLAKGTKKGSKKKGNGESFFATRNGIFRRRHTGFGGRVEVEAVWWFRKGIRTPARLRLWETAEEVFERFAVAYAMDAIGLVIERTSQKRLGS